MTVVQVFALAIVAIVAPAVVLSRDPLRQVMVAGIYGFALAGLFFVLQAPDVALSEIVVATIALPLMVLLAISKIRQHDEE
jgi:energy-converting hydrogenase B subunit D